MNEKLSLKVLSCNSVFKATLSDNAAVVSGGLIVHMYHSKLNNL